MTLSIQFYTMLAMVGMGSVFGATLDTYNRFLNRKIRKRWLVFLNDILFWILQALFIFYILFSVNFGEVRFYIFVALLCGFTGYQALLKDLYKKLLEKTIQGCVSFYNFLVRMLKNLVYSPIKWMVLLLVTILLGFGKGIWSVFGFLIKAIIAILKIVFTPFFWVVKLISRLIPKNLKKFVEKLYNKFAGYLFPFVKVIKTKLKKWFKR
ncbi:spore cortex biosynthesis protein YabQ [Bacillus salacetis]|uniref:Spore cortex biosynthesis protein YabQ n=1 Tax=Bacillus salacetis TaxID=2315464 RepID=A0A3A1QT63_9BACI|nr:spore cortex biosynthesis protein YabQ [Bacillus salacetis]RIW29859.1 spore cortex biosynthesis protein YabQ [Bacillus salacetis]